ncbi:hypothetical protein VTL71DRAFT_8364 [Oculimacula yallundae]|uniref:Protein kinase domain-containing protein n=1 Tax=Oculimacula yallundae TaxID=86028 RepID=A0ABR4CYL7_9HELO
MDQDGRVQSQLERYRRQSHQPVAEVVEDYVLFDHIESNLASQQDSTPPLLEWSTAGPSTTQQIYSQLGGISSYDLPRSYPAVQSQPTQEDSRVPDQSIRGSPNWAFGSPFFFSARSSPWIQASVTASPAWYSAKSSPMVAGIAMNNQNSRLARTESYKEPRVPQSPRLSAQRSLETDVPDQYRQSEYLLAVKSKGLILPVDQELNWSGKIGGGQHVEYSRGEELPFQALGLIGMSLTATVDKVRCKRILLARKTMTCGRRLTIDEALSEVEHLQKLRHPHIIQLVGSYMQGKKFSVLLYPVADCDLASFYEEVSQAMFQDAVVLGEERPSRMIPWFYGSPENTDCVQALSSFFSCLSNALSYIHSCYTKHLDIKPGNILVKKHPSYLYGYQVYIADFGISRSFLALDHSQTDTAIRRTPKYCAPEVWYQEHHGRAADIFSLGCVFMEMLTILSGHHLEDFSDFRSQTSDQTGAYHATIGQTVEWAYRIRPQLIENQPPLFLSQDYTLLLDHAIRMLAEKPGDRVLPSFPFCCGASREVYREE